MCPRLVLARNLLRNDGVIFISIDDGEVAQLRKISCGSCNIMDLSANHKGPHFAITNLTNRQSTARKILGV